MPSQQSEDPRSTEELLEAHRLEREDEGSNWSALWTIMRRGGRQEFEVGRRLSESAAPVDRVIGANLLAQLGAGSPVFQDEVVSILIRLLDDPDLDVVCSAALGLGHRNDPRAIEHLVALSQHPAGRVRYGVAFGLLAQDDPRAISALLQLSADDDLDTRNWAMFGLGTQIDTDTAAIREALANGLNDPDPEVRGEALVGLARRHDGRAMQALTRELEREDVVVLALEAAEILADRTLLSHLERLLASLPPDANSYFRDRLLEAIAACQAGRRST
jgi:HEAT repeat protein